MLHFTAVAVLAGHMFGAGVDDLFKFSSTIATLVFKNGHQTPRSPSVRVQSIYRILRLLSSAPERRIDQCVPALVSSTIVSTPKGRYIWPCHSDPSTDGEKSCFEKVSYAGIIVGRQGDLLGMIFG